VARASSPAIHHRKFLIFDIAPDRFPTMISEPIEIEVSRNANQACVEETFQRHV
jgi:hypothetical protein